MISSAVWIGADRESALSVSGGRTSPIETDEADSMSDTLHTSAYHTAGTEFPDSLVFGASYFEILIRYCFSAVPATASSYRFRIIV